MKKLYLYFLPLVFSLVLVNFALATETPLVDDKTKTDQYAQEMAFQNAAGIDAAPIGSIVSTLIKTVLGFLAVIFLVLMVYAGYLWMMAQGNEDQVEKAKKIITAAVIGLIIIVAAYSITYFIFSALEKASVGQGGGGGSSPTY